MTDEQTVEELFKQALTLNASQRAAFVAGLPDRVRNQIAELLAADESAEGMGLFGPVGKTPTANEPNPPTHQAISIDEPKITGDGSSAQSSAAGTGNLKIGRYNIQREIARGGMGIVYLATDPQLERQVAIKLLTDDRLNDQVWLERFHREARLASTLNHPNILTIYEVAESNGAPYISSEFVEGRTLRQTLNDGPMSMDQALNLGLQLARGIATAHAAGIVHRDLKPDNIMVRADGLLKILDFGLARVSQPTVADADAEPSISQTGMIVGTVSYMSPEQARGQKLGVSSDVFSFGTLMFLMLTGDRPFTGLTPSDTAAAILTRAPKAISDCGISLPPTLSRLLMRCLSKEPAHRPTSAEVVAELQQLLEPSRTGPASPSPPTKANEPARETAVPLSHDSTEQMAALVSDEPSEIRYAQSGDINIAWQIVGNGPIDLVFVMGWVSHLEWFWKDPSFATFLNRLASFSRVILFDKRGTGLSDRVPVNELPTLETRMDDVRAVMEAADSERAVLCGVSEGGPLCTMFAATYPHKTIALTMMGSYARRLWAEDYPWGPTAAQREVFLEEIGKNWGGPLGIEDRAPSMANDPDFRTWWASYLRMGASPGAAVALTKMNAQIDVRQILPSIQVPTLIIHRSGDRCLVVEEGRHMADLIPAAKFVELPGDDHLPFVGDSDAVLDELEEFLTGKRHAPAVDRVLATVLCVLIEDPSAVSSVNGPRSTRLQQFYKLVQHQVELFRGQNLSTTASSVLATFDGPARAVHAATAITGLASRLELTVRCGADTGACDVGPQAIAGPAVEYANRIAAISPIAGVLVAESVKNLVSGSGLDFIEASTIREPDQSEGRPLFQLVR